MNDPVPLPVPPQAPCDNQLLPPVSWCDNAPPVVRITGMVQSANAAVVGELAMPFANAEWELEVFAHADGQQDAAPEWQPLMSGPGGTGVALTGQLDQWGHFDTGDVFYPQYYELEDGTTWYGCPVTEPRVPFMNSHACENDDLVLKIYANSDDDMVRVKDHDNGGQRALIGEIPLGRFFEEDDGRTHSLDSHAGHAYVAAYNVKNLSANLPQEHQLEDVEIHLYNSLSGGGEYVPGSHIVNVKKSDTPHSDVEFYVGMQYYHDLMDENENYPGIPANCDVDNYREQVADAKCAFQLGFAAAVANAAETTPNEDVITVAGQQYGVEECAGSTPECQDGPKVGARIGAALRDLFDSTNEARDGFTDTVHRPFAELPPMIADAGPTDVEKFWDAYRERHGSRDRLVMFMNTLEYTELRDEDTGFATGSWQSTLCSTCRGGDLTTSDTGEHRPNLQWDFVNPSDEAQAFDLWVRLPAGQAQLAANATYKIHNPGSNPPGFDTAHATVDQTATADGWINLRPNGIGPIPENYEFSVTLSTPDGAKPVVADAIIAAPHEDDTTGPYPLVQVSGGAHTHASFDSKNRPLAGACYEVLYKGHDGDPQSPIQWRPVLDSRTPNGEPTGNPVKGCLDQEGKFVTTGFAYPNQFELNDESTWVGCPAPPNPVEFMGSHACADSDLILRVSTTNATGTNHVRLHVLSNPAAVAGDVPIGHFFLRDPASMSLQSAEARAYGAILSVRDLVPTFGKAVKIVLRDSGESKYIPGVIEERIELVRGNAITTVAEKMVAHVLEHDLVGGDYDVPSCDDGGWMARTSDECAWRAGFSSFIAIAAEHLYRSSDASVPSFDLYSAESCEEQDCDERGPDVEGRVAMALWDLYDENADEFDGFQDNTGLDEYTSLKQILDVVRDVAPDTFSQYWREWNERHDTHSYRDEETMFLNGMLYTAALDAGDEHTEFKGSWETMDCTDCMAGSFERSQEATTSVTWNIGSQLQDDGEYEIWVKLPLTEDPLDSAAVYTVITETGPVEYVVDQMSDRWVNLKPLGLRLKADPATTVTLTHGPANPNLPLAADALLIVPANPVP
ncbi:hypothetical protein [Catellatospora sp. NPDC049609]|uniref:golvesin C-terminal-like domain-containing protein n=1 Tax=Catellatospora sp. NPDC049609 TaxID=3155505 RepID=UPI003441C7BD